MYMNFLMMKLYAITDHTPNHVDTFKRFVAFAIDWVFGYLCIAAPVAILWLYHTKDAGNLVTNVAILGGKLGASTAYLAIVLSILIAIVYFVFYPLRNHGQTFGKKFMGLKIVKTNDEEVDLKTLFLRQVLGVFLLEGYFCMISEMMRQLMVLHDLNTAYLIFSFLAIFISAISAFLCMKFESHRALHDYLAKTKVIAVDETK